jgi:hypothetical protein
MHSPTIANNFSFRLTLAFVPFQPPSSYCARCLPSKSRVLTLLRTLFLSLRSFLRAPRLFSAACGLFLQNTGGMGYLCDISAPARSSGGPLRYHLQFFCRPFIFIHLQIPPRRASIYNILCFHALTNPFFRNFFVFTSIQNARVSPHLTTFPPTVSTRFSGNFPFPQSRAIVLASKGDLLNVSE